TKKRHYKIAYEKIHHVLSEAKRSNLKEVQAQWGSFLSKLKTRSARAHETIQDSKPTAASESALIVALKYEINCWMILDNQDIVEWIFSQEVGKQMDIITIPAQDWKELRSEYVTTQEQKSLEKTKEKEQSDPLIEEARKLVGDDLLEIHD